MFTDTKCELIHSMGTDLSVVIAAEMLLNNHTKTENRKYNVEQKFLDTDKAFLDHLVSENHESPFEHCTATFMIKCPLFIARQIMKHRGFSFNEVNRRYTSSSIEFWELKKIRPQIKSNDSITGGIYGSHADNINDTYKQFIDDAYAFYQQMIEAGVAKEQALSVLPQSMHTSFYMTGNLINWIAFFKIINKKDTQSELRTITRDILQKLHTLYPQSMLAWGINASGVFR